MFKKNFNLYYRATMQLFKVYILGLIVFMCFRTALLLTHGNFSELRGYKADLLHAYWVGFRFDTAVLAYGFAFLFVLNLLILVVPPKTYAYYNTVRRFSFWYIGAAFLVFLLILFVDFFFYTFFQSHFNELIFGVARGETRAVLTSVWTDYPVVSIMVITAIIMVFLARSVKYLLNREYEVRERSSLFRVSFVILCIGLYILALRGSLGSLPISKDKDSYISPNIFLNDLTMNGVFSLKEAFSESEKEKIAADGSAFNGACDLPFVNTSTNPFLKEKPPHVVFILMESMSNYYLDLHSPTMNLLGTLEKELPHCIIFRNFLPAGSGTIQSLETLMIGASKTSLAEAQSSYINKSLASSVALPFLKAGFHTSFMTGGNLRFCNLDRFVPRQYFETAEGSETLLTKMRHADSGTWGVYDEFLFERVFEKLQNSKGKPQFLFVVTVTNHTPYDLPKNYRPFPISIPPEIHNKVKAKEDLAMKNFTAYQYANDSLGRFLDKLRNSPYGENTIVAVTGDHNTLHLFPFSYTQLLQKLSVPLILYVPSQYRPVHAIDASRFGSHKDIFPTLFHLALSEASYLKTGNNLFDDITPEHDFFALNDRTVMNRDGCILMQDKPVFYSWQKSNTTLLEPSSLLKTPELEKLLRTAQVYRASLDHLMKNELTR